MDAVSSGVKLARYLRIHVRPDLQPDRDVPISIEETIALAKSLMKRGDERALIVIKDADRTPDDADHLLRSILAASERGGATVLVTSETEAGLLDDAIVSGFYRLAQTNHYRLSPWGMEQIGRVGQPRGFDVDRVLDLTGGHPGLVLELQRLATDYGYPEDAEQAFLDCRPLFVRAWVRRLEQLLKGSSADQRMRFRRYTQGVLVDAPQSPAPSVRHAPFADERNLYLAGWLGWDRQGLWGLRSEYHRGIAAEVLRGAR